MSDTKDHWQRLDLILAVRDVLTTHSDAPVDVLAERVVNAVEDWCLDSRFSQREKWIRFNAWRRRGVHSNED